MLNNNQDEQNEINNKQDKSSEKINPDLINAVKEVASSLGGNAQNTEIELLKVLNDHINETEEMKKGVKFKDVSKNISDVFVGMKIDQKKPEQQIIRHSPYENLNATRSNEARGKSITSKFKQNISSRWEARVDFNKSPRLGIFNIETENLKQDTPKTSIWDKLMEEELQLLVNQNPKNAFEEMIQWTEEGKLWKFPIDNEYGLDEEMKIPFHEHVFLDYLLEDFPKKGPIRHFMELVITGLSKNPYITVERKKEHVEWYRQYFKEKEDILRETGAL